MSVPTEPGFYPYKYGKLKWAICEVDHLGDVWVPGVGYNFEPEMISHWEFGPRVPDYDPNEEKPALYSTERDRLVAVNVVAVAVDVLNPDWESIDKVKAVGAILERVLALMEMVGKKSKTRRGHRGGKNNHKRKDK